jgi:hypothetical protein
MDQLLIQRLLVAAGNIDPELPSEPPAFSPLKSGRDSAPYPHWPGSDSIVSHQEGLVRQISLYIGHFHSKIAPFRVGIAFEAWAERLSNEIGWDCQKMTAPDL